MSPYTRKNQCVMKQTCKTKFPQNENITKLIDQFIINGIKFRGLKPVTVDEKCCPTHTPKTS